jgi:hypothetical protein
MTQRDPRKGGNVVGPKATANPVAVPSGGATGRDAIEMSYADAMELKAMGGGGRRSVLTEQGWVRVDGGTGLD